MNGIHDMGGMHGFGPVEREENEPVFHHPWEGRVFAMRVVTPVPIPGGARYNIETMDPRALPAVQLLREVAARPRQGPDRQRRPDA